MMLSFLDSRPILPTMWVSTIITLLGFGPAVLSLSTAPGSPCAGQCHKTSTNTTSAEIVCLDKQYHNTQKGVNFRECVACELNSTYSDPDSGESDVNWGLCTWSDFSIRYWANEADNLRFAITSCLFGFPNQVVNMSSPCVVSCQDLEPALETNLLDPNGFNFGTWCGSSAYADNDIDQCEFCYNLTVNQKVQQVFIANCAFIHPVPNQTTD